LSLPSISLNKLQSDFGHFHSFTNYHYTLLTTNPTNPQIKIKMRFAIVASALFAGLVAAEPAMTQTIHSTAVETITSCGPEV
jgi:hypothetical protein